MKIIDTVMDTCPICYKEHFVNICEEEKEVEYRGDKITYNHRFCSCPDTPENSENGNCYYFGTLLNQNLMKIKDIYRRNHNLLTSEEIINTRNILNLGQKDFSLLLNWEPDKIKDFEERIPQTEEENSKILFVKNNINFVKYLISKNDNNLNIAGTELDKFYSNPIISESTSDIFDVARYILDNFQTEPLTTMKLQKLCFYCYVWCLILNKNRLFRESIVAWDFGPVVKDLFYKHKGQYILTDIKGNTDNISSENKIIMDTVLKTYGILSPSQLVDKTHSEDPWKDTERNCVITDEKIIRYYSDKEFSI